MQDFRIMQAMASEQIRCTEGGKAVRDPGLNADQTTANRGTVSVARILAAGYAVLDRPNQRYVLTDPGRAALASHLAEREAGRTDMQRALQSVTVRHAD
jgi:hypothetical protein